jgi:hypothetical protein
MALPRELTPFPPPLPCCSLELWFELVRRERHSLELKNVFVLYLDLSARCRRLLCWCFTTWLLVGLLVLEQLQPLTLKWPSHQLLLRHYQLPYCLLVQASLLWPLLQLPLLQLPLWQL